MLRVLAQQHFVGAQALDDALGIVQPVDAENQGALAHGRAQLFIVAARLGRAAELLDLRHVDPDRHRHRLHPPLADLEAVARARLGPQLAHREVGEMVHVPGALEADHVVGAQVLADLLVPGQSHKDLGGGSGMCKKKPSRASISSRRSSVPIGIRWKSWIQMASSGCSSGFRMAAKRAFTAR